MLHQLTQPLPLTCKGRRPAPSDRAPPNSTRVLICCDVEARGQTWFFHEKAEGWDDFLRYLAHLPSFRQDWRKAVVHPPFAACETVAFDRG